MCYPLPGPRCSSHTRASLIAARTAWREAGTPEAKERYLTARDEYDTSPEGIARNRSLLEHHIENGLSTRYVKSRLAMGEQTRAEGIEAMDEQGITVEEEEAVTPYDEAGRDVEGFDAAGQDAQGTTVEAAEANLRRQVLSESDYQFLKEMGPKHWTPADRKALQEYSTAEAALNIAKADDSALSPQDAEARRLFAVGGLDVRDDGRYLIDDVVAPSPLDYAESNWFSGSEVDFYVLEQDPHDTSTYHYKSFESGDDGYVVYETLSFKAAALSDETRAFIKVGESRNVKPWEVSPHLAHSQDYAQPEDSPAAAFASRQFAEGSEYGAWTVTPVDDDSYKFVGYENVYDEKNDYILYQRPVTEKNFSRADIQDMDENF